MRILRWKILKLTACRLWKIPPSPKKRCTAPLEAEDGADKQAFAQIVKTIEQLKCERKIARSENEHLLAEMLWTTVHVIISLKLI